jgi:hypothetical protein
VSGDAGDSGGEGGDGEPSDWEDEASSSDDSECGDNGALPGGIGGMGQDGECIGGGGGGGSSSSDSSASSSDASGGASGGGGGGAAGGSVQGTGGAGGVAEFPDESDAERAERLGQELEESLGGFDGTLQEEQDEISAAGRSTEGFGEGSQGSGGGGISLGQQGSGGGGGGGAGGNNSGGGNPISVANSGISRESPVAGMSQEEIRERTPEDIPITVDDDIIARQLREAALTEEDPALRERLWEEYRKYSGT